MDSVDQRDEPVEGFVTLHLPCQYGYLRIIRQSVMDLCIRAGVSEFKASQLEMAVDEACANIIEHSYGGETAVHEDTIQHPGLRVNLIQRRDRVTVEIHDRGKGFDFTGHPPVEPDRFVDAERERGLGMYIITRFVDEADYQRGTRSGNVLRLTKRL